MKNQKVYFSAIEEFIMYKHLFFLDSKTLDWLTPYILVLASDTIAFNVFVLTFVSAAVFSS